MNLQVNSVETLVAEYSVIETPQLLEKLGSAIRITAEALLEIAVVVRVLEERGEDLSTMKVGMIDWFRKIAYGQVLPAVFERYRFKPRLLEVIASLPIPDQQKLSSGGTVPVLAFGEGGLSERQVDPLEMTREEAKQVFYRGAIRTLSEQRGWLNDRTRPRVQNVQELETGVVVDRKKRRLIINGFSVSRSQLLSYLSQLED